MSGEIKCSAKQQTSVYVRTARAMMDAENPKDGRPTFDQVTMSGLGPAITVVISAATKLEKEGFLITKVQTDMPEMTGDDHVTRHVAQIRITVGKKIKE